MAGQAGAKKAKRWIHLREYLWLALICFAAYASTIANGFVWLDKTEILNAEYRITNLEDLRLVFTEPLDVYAFRGEGNAVAKGGYWRPVYALVISVEWLLLGDWSQGYHFVSLLVHLVLVALLYRLALTLSNDKIQRRISFWSIAVFAALPINMQSVAWVSGQKDPLCAIFCIASLLLLLRFVASAKVRVSTLVGATILFVLALGSKELAIVLPLLFLAVATYLWDSTQPKPYLSKTLIATLTLSLVSTGYLMMRRQVTGQLGFGASGSIEGWADTLRTCAVSTWHYCYHALLPFPGQLSDRWARPTEWGTPELTSAAAAVGLVLLCLQQRLRTLATLGIAWFLIWLLPVLGFIELRHAFAERYLYPASWGLWAFLLAIIFYGVVALTQRMGIEEKKSLSFCGTVSCLLVLSMIVLCNVESLHWENDEVLFANAVRNDPHYLEGHVALGHAFYENEQYEKAVTSLDRAFKESEAFADEAYWSPYLAHIHRGAALQSLNRHGEALADYRAAQELQPTLTTPLAGASVCAIAIGELKQAEGYLNAILAINPKNKTALGNLGYVKLHQNETQAAEEILRPLSRPDNASLTDLRNYGTALILQHKYLRATSVFERILKRNPELVADKAKLAWALWGSGEFDLAAKTLENARREDPNHSTVRYVIGLMDAKP